MAPSLFDVVVCRRDGVDAERVASLCVERLLPGEQRAVTVTRTLGPAEVGVEASWRDHHGHRSSCLVQLPGDGVLRVKPR